MIDPVLLHIAASLLLAVVVFGTMCWSRSWLLNPNYNYLSWSYAFAVICGGFEIFAGMMLLYVSTKPCKCKPN